MNLWIRSQAKDELVKSSRIKIEEGFETKNGITTTYYTIYNFDGVHINYLGMYKTKERALQILDEIQNFLLNKEIKIEYLQVQQEKEYKRIKEMIKNGTFYAIPESSVEYIEPSCIVYEMPKE